MNLSRLLPFIKYCIVGVSGTLLDLASLYIFVEYASIPILLASAFSFLLAVINNFLLNKFWTFQNASKNYRKQFIKFFIVSLIGLGLTLSAMYLFVHVIGIWYMAAKALTSGIVLTWNFLGNKLWTFRAKKNDFPLLDHYRFDLSIIIPAYNEEHRIGDTLKKIDEYLHAKNIATEIIVINDGSSDHTNEILKKYQKTMPNLKMAILPKNHGKGFAVKTGVRQSLGRYILFADSDNSTPIEEYEKLFKALKNCSANIAIGSRYLAGSNVQIRQPKYRIWLGRIGNFLISFFLIDGIKDTQCGFKLFEHKAAKRIFAIAKVKRFGFDMEILAIANLLGYKITEVPVSWLNSSESRVRPIKDALITLKDLVYIKLNLLSGRYMQDK